MKKNYESASRLDNDLSALGQYETRSQSIIAAPLIEQQFPETDESADCIDRVEPELPSASLEESIPKK